MDFFLPDQGAHRQPQQKLSTSFEVYAIGLDNPLLLLLQLPGDLDFTGDFSVWFTVFLPTS